MSIFKQIRRLLDLAEQQQGKTDQTDELIRQSTKELHALRESVNKHDIVMEDMLDEWQSFQDQQTEEKENLRQALLGQLQSESKSLAESEQALLSLSMDFQDQLFALRRAASEEAEPSPWARQILLTEEKLRPSLEKSGLQPIDAVGEPFSYQLHESVQVTDTDDPALGMHVSDVLSCGYLYRGKILRKALVSVWRLNPSEGNADNSQTNRIQEDQNL